MISIFGSHPVWVRGLKLRLSKLLLLSIVVAPCVGAWIETDDDLFEVCSNRVAPCVGAWIETLNVCMSVTRPKVAPCVGAWIETKNLFCFCIFFASHPVWVRGLKLCQLPKLAISTCRTLCGCVD